MNKPPCEEYVGNVSPFTASELTALQVKLDKQLGPEYISTRPQGSGPVSYLETAKAYNLANEVFGFHRWSTQIIRDQVDFVDYNKESGRYNVGITVHVRITLQNGVFREDYGYGSIDNCQSKAKAFEKAKKEGVSDGMKRALRQFGNVLGNCLYDKQYLQQVHRVKAPNKPFKVDRLYRGPEYPLQQSTETLAVHNSAKLTDVPTHGSTGMDDSREVRAATNVSGDFRESDIYGGDDLDLVDFFPMAQGGSPNGLAGSKRDSAKDRTTAPTSHDLLESSTGHLRLEQASKPTALQNASSDPQSANNEANVPAAFYSAKMAAEVQNNAPLPPEAHYDASRQSPLIRRSTNVNHDKSMPTIRRQTEGGRTVPINGVTPQRLVGMPPASRPTIANYKAPSMMKRPLEATEG